MIPDLSQNSSDYAIMIAQTVRFDNLTEKVQKWVVSDECHSV